MIKRYQYYSKGFKSNVTLDYNDGYLCGVEIEGMNTTEPVEPKAYFFTTEVRFLAMCKEHKVPFKEVNRVITFDMFWDKYALKKDRPLAEEQWQKMKPEEHLAAYDFIPKYIQQLDGVAKKYAVRYLKHRPWKQ